MTKNELVQKIGEEVYLRLEKEANTEVAEAMKMPLKNEHGQEKWYCQRYLFCDLIRECELFHNLGLNFSPLDVVNILFRCKLAFAVSDEEEYNRRLNGFSHDSEYDFILKWEDKEKGFDLVVDKYVARIESFIEEKTLLTTLSNFDYDSLDANYTPKEFFENLFIKISAPFVVFFEDDQLLNTYSVLQPHLPQTLNEARKYFQSPSIGFKVIGSSMYAKLYATAWLRTFLNMLRISSFIYRPQIDFGRSGVEILAPTTSVFLGTHSSGVNSWDEDSKKPWEKNPDGSLFLSFGYRGLAKMWLDNRANGGIEKFILENKIIFDYLNNPWADESINDIAPTLDILSSATQTPDLGAKVLLLYCCLEHLFVPKDKDSNNKTYIEGGIYALNKDLMPWFKRLYDIRCDYAHRGYILKTSDVGGLIFESTTNVMKLLVTKLSKKS